MRNRWTEEKRNNRIEAEWIVSWLRDNSPATIKEIISALNDNGKDVKAHIIRRALIKSQFVTSEGYKIIDGDRHTIWTFTSE